MAQCHLAGIEVKMPSVASVASNVICMSGDLGVVG